MEAISTFSEHFSLNEDQVREYAEQYIRANNVSSLAQLCKQNYIDFSLGGWRLGYIAVNYPGSLRYICENSDFLKKEGTQILRAAFDERNLDSIQYLSQKGLSLQPSVLPYNALPYDFWSSSQESVSPYSSWSSSQQLIESEIYVMAEDYIQAGNLAVIKQLKEKHKLDFSHNNWHLGYLSIDHPDILRYICENSDFLKKEGEQALIAAVYKKNRQSIDYLINQGVSDASVRNGYPVCEVYKSLGYY